MFKANQNLSFYFKLSEMSATKSRFETKKLFRMSLNKYESSSEIHWKFKSLKCFSYVKSNHLFLWFEIFQNCIRWNNDQCNKFVHIFVQQYYFPPIPQLGNYRIICRNLLHHSVKAALVQWSNELVQYTSGQMEQIEKENKNMKQNVWLKHRNSNFRIFL